MELSILNVSKPNTPSSAAGIFRRTKDHSSAAADRNYKFVVVSYESFNVSWTSGLPYEELKVEEEKITLDPTKKYVAFTFSGRRQQLLPPVPYAHDVPVSFEGQILHRVDNRARLLGI